MTPNGRWPLQCQPRFSGMGHNFPMASPIPAFVCLACLLLADPAVLQAQEDNRDRGGISDVEESDEAYRRRMELEDARQRDLGYTLPPETYAQQQEKLDQLPGESRDNIRDQLVDIIVENGDWEPADALREYPYEPTAAAQANPELMEQEQEAWDEQIEKYHRREAAAYGTYLGDAPGPGDPAGREGGGAKAGGTEESQQSGGRTVGDGQQPGAQPPAGEAGPNGAAGTYEPYQSNRGPSGEATSTAGVRQSALEFVKGMQSQGRPPAAGTAEGTDASARTDTQAAPPDGQRTAAEQEAPDPDAGDARPAQESESAETTDDTVEIDLTTPGIIAIEDLDKLEGTGSPGAGASEGPP